MTLDAMALIHDMRGGCLDGCRRRQCGRELTTHLDCLSQSTILALPITTCYRKHKQSHNHNNHQGTRLLFANQLCDASTMTTIDLAKNITNQHNITVSQCQNNTSVLVRTRKRSKNKPVLSEWRRQNCRLVSGHRHTNQDQDARPPIRHRDEDNLAKPIQQRRCCYSQRTNMKSNHEPQATRQLRCTTNCSRQRQPRCLEHSDRICETPLVKLIANLIWLTFIVLAIPWMWSYNNPLILIANAGTLFHSPSPASTLLYNNNIHNDSPSSLHIMNNDARSGIFGAPVIASLSNTTLSYVQVFDLSLNLNEPNEHHSQKSQNSQNNKLDESNPEEKQRIEAVPELRRRKLVALMTPTRSLLHDSNLYLSVVHTADRQASTENSPILSNQTDSIFIEVETATANSANSSTNNYAIHVAATATAPNTQQSSDLSESRSDKNNNKNHLARFSRSLQTPESPQKLPPLALSLTRQQQQHEHRKSGARNHHQQQQRAPSITVHPQDVSALAGDASELTCEADGEPKPTIEWFRNGKPLAPTRTRTAFQGSLQFLELTAARVTHNELLDKIDASGSDDANPLSINVDYNNSDSEDGDQGVYWCVASNGVGAPARSRNATVDIAFIGSQFVQAPRSQTVAAGDTLTLECVAPVTQPAHVVRAVTWRHNSIPVTPDTYNKRIVERTMASAVQSLSHQQRLTDVIVHQLIVSNVRKDDAGNYTCVVHMQAQPSAASSSVTRSLDTIDQHQQQQQQAVSISSNNRHRVERESKPATVQVHTRPQFIEPPQHQLVQRHHTARFACKMSGEPEPVISWRKQNGQPLSERTHIEPIDKTLIIESVTDADQGIYVCEGENDVGTIRTFANLTVISKPTFVLKPHGISTSVGTSVQFDCWGDALPRPLIYWYKEGVRQLMFVPSTNYISIIDVNSAANIGSTNQARISVFANGTLSIRNVSRHDHGHYACVLISSVGSTMAQAKLSVTHAQTSIGAQQQQQQHLIQQQLQEPPPVIRMAPLNQTLPVDTSVRLACDIASVGPYTLEWLMNGERVRDDSVRIQVLSSGPAAGTLAIEALKMSDSGTYTCQVHATNTGAIVSASATLKVASVMNPNIKFYRAPDVSTYPAAPGAPQLISTNGQDALTIGWQAPGDAGASPLAEYVVEHFDTSTSSTTTPTGTFGSTWRVIAHGLRRESLLVDGLSFTGVHYFIVRAANTHGFGPSSLISSPMLTLAGQQWREEHQLLPAAAATATSTLTSMARSDQDKDLDMARERLAGVSTTLVSLTASSSSALKLVWTLMAASAAGAPLEGFSIRYRIVSSAQASSLQSTEQQQVSNNKQAKSNKSINNESNDLQQQVLEALQAPESLIQSKIDMTLQRVRRSFNDNNNHNNRQPTSNGNHVLAIDEPSQSSFSEIKVVDPNIESYTINGLRAYTAYEMFVIPYYKSIDATPSNLMISHTLEDRPTVAPPNLSVTLLPHLSSAQNTSSPTAEYATVRLSWSPVPAQYANGLVRGYHLYLRPLMSTINTVPSVLQAQQQQQQQPLVVPVNSITDFDPVTQTMSYNVQVNLSSALYSVQVAAYTSAGAGPASDAINLLVGASTSSSAGNQQLQDLLDITPIESLSSSNGGTWDIATKSFMTGTVIGVLTALISGIAVFVISVTRRNKRALGTTAWHHHRLNSGTGNSSSSAKFNHDSHSFARAPMITSSSASASGSGATSTASTPRHPLLGYNHQRQQPLANLFTNPMSAASANENDTSLAAMMLSMAPPTGPTTGVTGPNKSQMSVRTLRSSIGGTSTNGSSLRERHHQHELNTSSEIYPTPLIGPPTTITSTNLAIGASHPEYYSTLANTPNGQYEELATTINSQASNYRPSPYATSALFGGAEQEARHRLLASLIGGKTVSNNKKPGDTDDEDDDSMRPMLAQRRASSSAAVVRSFNAGHPTQIANFGANARCQQQQQPSYKSGQQMQQQQQVQQTFGADQQQHYELEGVSNFYEQIDYELQQANCNSSGFIRSQPSASTSSSSLRSPPSCSSLSRASNSQQSHTKQRDNSHDHQQQHAMRVFNDLPRR